MILGRLKWAAIATLIVGAIMMAGQWQAPTTVECDVGRGRGRIVVEGLLETSIEPIRNPVTGEEHQARIELPHGFEFRVAEMGDSVHWWTKAGEHLAMEHDHSYAQMAHINWRSDGSVRSSTCFVSRVSIAHLSWSRALCVDSMRIGSGHCFTTSSRGCGAIRRRSRRPARTSTARSR